MADIQKVVVENKLRTCFLNKKKYSSSFAGLKGERAHFKLSYVKDLATIMGNVLNLLKLENLISPEKFSVPRQRAFLGIYGSTL